MTGEERKELRMKLLQEHYDYHFANNGLGKQLTRNRIDSEQNLAYQYLEEKKLIIKHSDGREFDYKISAYGIDQIESKGRSNFFV